ncbi:MAG: alginate lyase family protein [Saprospiraceae bacterium]|nr:alginate lyase family protein [Saprospiraceae bacterium]
MKIIWEISRFDWVTDLARAYKISGNEKYLLRLNVWLEDWSSNNPLNIGPNWKCGQETSFRVMKLLTAAHCLSQYNAPSSGLKEMIKQHVVRIYPNINYAISQDNNHGTSEAIGLYIGAAWLIQNGETSPKFKKFKRIGRQVLEERILKLIQVDCTFAQKSMTYHRVAVDTISFALHNMALLNEPAFNSPILERLSKLGEWQYKLTFGKEGMLQILVAMMVQ